jgi:ribokinase
MKKIPSILTIGKATQDVFLTSTKEFAPYEHKGVAYEQLPLGKKIHLDEVIFSTGGNATNAATTFARQGIHSQWMWAIGTDVASRAILHELDHEGIDTRHAVELDSYRASYSTLLLAPTGERTVLNFPGSNLPNTGYPLVFDCIKDADWLYLSSINNMKLLEKIVSIAAQHQTKIMMNPSGLELAEKEKLKSLFSDVTVLAVNKEEAQEVVEGSTLEELTHHALRYCPVVIISDGPNGVVASDGKTLVRAGMYEDVPVVDRTGAGDAFGSGFLSQWAQGSTLEESIIFASANSTSVVTKIGAKEGILHKGVKLHHMPIDTKQL